MGGSSHELRFTSYGFYRDQGSGIRDQKNRLRFTSYESRVTAVPGLLFWVIVLIVRENQVEVKAEAKAEVKEVTNGFSSAFF